MNGSGPCGPAPSAGGGSIAAVTRELGWARVTVRKYLDEAAPSRKVAAAPRPRPVWDAVASRLQALLAESVRWTGDKQQGLTATRLHTLLVAEGHCVRASRSSRTPPRSGSVSGA